MKKRILFGLLLITAGLFLAPTLSAQTNTSPEIKSLRGEIIQITEDEVSEETILKLFTVQLDTGEVVIIEEQFRPELNTIEFQIGDNVIVDQTTFGDEINYVITDFQRTNYFFLLLGIFILLVIIIGRKQGLLSLISLGISYFLIFQILIRQIINGLNSLLAAIILAIIVIPLNYYVGHQINRKTTYAVLSTIITLILVGGFSLWIVNAANLTGYTSDEAGFLVQLTGGVVNLQDLLLAGIFVGLIGILDDITISQASIANQLKASKPKISFNELFSRTITVGKDHISSLVNTLILVYTSTALPLLVILEQSESDFLTTLNREIIMEELVIMLLTSIGLILAVPITTYISCFFIQRYGAEDSEHDHHHHDHGHSH